MRRAAAVWLVCAAALSSGVMARAQLIHLTIDGVITERKWGADWGEGTDVGDSFQLNLWFGSSRGDENRWRLWAGGLDLFAPLDQQTGIDATHLHFASSDPWGGLVFDFQAELTEPWSIGSHVPPAFAAPARLYVDYFSSYSYPGVPPGEWTEGGRRQGWLRGEATSVEVDFAPVPEPATYGAAMVALLTVVIVGSRRPRLRTVLTPRRRDARAD